MSTHAGIGALDELGLSSKEISTLVGATNSAFKAGDFADGARVIFDAARDLIEASAGYIALLARDGSNNEVLFLEAGGRPCLVDPTLPMPIRGLRAEAYRQCKVVYHNGFADSRWMSMLPTGHVIVDNVLFAPLVINERAVGLMGLANKKGDFTERDAALAGVFGEMAASVLRYSLATEELRVSEERHRTIVDSAQDAVVTSDSDGIICGWNNAAERMFRRNANEIVGKALTEIMPQRFRRMHRPAVRKAGANGALPTSGAPMELMGLRGDGREFPIELTLAGWNAGGNHFFTGFIRDISKRKETEAALDVHRSDLERIVQERTEALNETLSELRCRERELRASAGRQTVLLQEMNHRVRNNLTSLLGLLHQELTEIADSDGPNCNGALRSIESRIRSMAEVQDMMAEGGGQDLDLAKLAERSVAATLRSNSNRISTEVKVVGAEAVVNSRQAQHLSLIFSELATNTLKHGPLKGAAISIEITRRGAQLELRYADNGTGYPDSVLDGSGRPALKGLRLLEGLVSHSLRGSLSLSNEGGAVARISFELDEPLPAGVH